MKTRQTGAALMMALVILLIMTLIGLSALQTSTLDMKIVANMKENVSAFHNAETGMEQAFDRFNSNRPLYSLNPKDNFGTYTVTGSTLGIDCTTLTMQVIDADDLDATPATAWGDPNLDKFNPGSDHTEMGLGMSGPVGEGCEFIMQAEANRCSNAKATHLRAFQSEGASCG